LHLWSCGILSYSLLLLLPCAVVFYLHFCTSASIYECTLSSICLAYRIGNESNSSLLRCHKNDPSVAVRINVSLAVVVKACLQLSPKKRCFHWSYCSKNVPTEPLSSNGRPLWLRYSGFEAARHNTEGYWKTTSIAMKSQLA
jgi:hypothetical protein